MTANEKIVLKAIQDTHPDMSPARAKELSKHITQATEDICKQQKVKDTALACTKVSDLIYSGVVPSPVGLPQMGVNAARFDGAEEEE